MLWCGTSMPLRSSHTLRQASPFLCSMSLHVCKQSFHDLQLHSSALRSMFCMLGCCSFCLWCAVYMSNGAMSIVSFLETLLQTHVLVQGMVPIILSWFVSPILAFIATSILFVGVRTMVLRRKNSFNLGCIALAFLVGLTFFVIVVFIIQTGEQICSPCPPTNSELLSVAWSHAVYSCMLALQELKMTSGKSLVTANLSGLGW